MALIVGAFGAAASAGGPTAPDAATAARDGLIAFMRPGTLGGYDIWVVRPDGKGLRRLTRAPSSHEDYNPTWSPDGSTVLFERRGDPNGEDLYTIPAAGGTPTRLVDCTGDCWSDGEARFSKDGSQLAFSRATGPRSASMPSLVAVHVMDSEGNNLRRLSHPPKGFEDHYPTWAPDGKTIVFQRDSNTEGGGRTRLVAVNVLDGRERVLYSLPSWAPGAGIPSFSPNGQKILFGFWCIYGDQCPSVNRTRQHHRQATINTQGRGLRMLPLTLRADSASWAPSGTRIVYRCSPADLSRFNLCVSRLDGKDLKRFPWPLQSAHPSWGTHP